MPCCCPSFCATGNTFQIKTAIKMESFSYGGSEYTNDILYMRSNASPQVPIILGSSMKADNFTLTVQGALRRVGTNECVSLLQGNGFPCKTYSFCYPAMVNCPPTSEQGGVWRWELALVDGGVSLRHNISGYCLSAGDRTSIWNYARIPTISKSCDQNRLIISE